MNLLLSRLLGWCILPSAACFSGGCLQALRALAESLIQLLESAALQTDFLSERGHGCPQRIKVATAAGLFAGQRRKRISVLKRGEQLRGQSLRRLLAGQRVIEISVEPCFEAAYDPFPHFG